MPLIQTVTSPIWYADHRDPNSNLPVTLLVHGAGGTHLDWPAQLRRMPEANAIVVDLPGHGRSPGRGRRSVAAYAADMIALLNALKVRRAIVAGHSMGGAIAQTMAIQYPDRVHGIVLLSTAAKLGLQSDLLVGFMTEWVRSISWVINWYSGRITSQSLRRRVRQQWLETRSAIMWQDYLACSRFDVSTHLAKVQHPALIIGGTDDNMTPFRYSEQLHNNIVNSELVRLEGCPHTLALLQPEWVVPALREWLLEHDWQKEPVRYSPLRVSDLCNAETKNLREALT